MKLKDHVRLSKISLKAKKKTTKATVRGISFGLILLLPLLFLVSAFYIDLNQEVNKESGIRVFDIPVIETKTEDTYLDSILASDIKKLNDLEGVSNIIEYSQYYLYAYSNEKSEDFITHLSIRVGEDVIPLNKHLVEEKEEKSPFIGLSVLNDENAQDVFLKSDYDVLNGNSPLVSGSTFSSNSKQEIMLSSNLVNMYNLSEEIVGKTISLSQILVKTDSITINKTDVSGNEFDNYVGLDVNIFKDFKVVGIFNSEIYQTSIRHKTHSFNYSNNDFYGTDFWITNKSINNTYLPELVKIQNEDYDTTAFYYESNPVSLAKNAIDLGYAFLPFGFGVNLKMYDGIKTAYCLVEFDSYASANKAVSIINSLITDSALLSSESISVNENYMVETFASYRLFYNIFTYVCIALAIFGGIIFFATLLNLYNTIHYAVQSKKNYIGMLRAIGMKNKEVLRLYLMEILVIFNRSYIWTAIFGGLICGGIYFVFEEVMNSEYAKMLLIDLSLDPKYILISFAILVIVNLIISMFFAIIATNKVSKAPILAVLDDKQ